MRRILSAFLLTFFLLAGVIAIAQENNSWQLRAKLLTCYANVTDPAFSSLSYSGFAVGGEAGVRYEKDRSMHEWAIAYSGGRLKQDVNRLQQTYITGGYTYLNTVHSSGNFEYKAGGSIDMLYARRDYEHFINAGISNELIASLSAAGEISCSLFNGFTVADRLQLPLVSALMQPSIYEEDPPGKEGSRLNDFLKSNRVASFGSFLRIKNNLILEKSIGMNQSISFAYTWDYYKVKDKVPVRQANHQVGIIYSYIF
jgi:hypothetical protein